MFCAGDDGKKSVRYDFALYDSKTYLHLGQLTAVTLLQGGQGLPIFCQSVSHYITTGNIADSVDELPETVKLAIKKVPHRHDIVLVKNNLFSLAVYFLI